MMRVIHLTVLALVLSFSGIAQSNLTAPRVLFAVENFYHPEHGPYVELYLSFDALSLQYEKVEDYYQAKLEVLYVIKKGESVIKYQKFEVLSPEMKTEKGRQNFADVQKMTLEPGYYTVDVSIWDANREIEPVKASQKLNIRFKANKMAMSNIIFEKVVVPTEKDGPFVKNGYLMTPWLISTIPAAMEELYIYSEVYNSDFELGGNGAYVEKHMLRNLDIDSIFENYSLIKRVNTSKVNVILRQLDLKALPDGTYGYTIELFNRDNELVGSNGKQFYRQSDIPSLKNGLRTAEIVDFESHIRAATSRDSIVDYIRCIRPLGTRADQNFIDYNWNKASTEVLQSYLIGFWVTYKTENVFKEWIKYRSLVKLVNKEFGSAAKPGYDTDMGMVYLKYGAPDQITDRANEPSSYPYIIWQYYAHPLQSNAMYVFYDPSLTYRDYQLLHCNVRDEKNNPRWKLILQSRNNPNGDVDKDSGEDHWGGEVDDYYTNPR